MLNKFYFFPNPPNPLLVENDGRLTAGNPLPALNPENPGIPAPL